LIAIASAPLAVVWIHCVLKCRLTSLGCGKTISLLRLLQTGLSASWQKICVTWDKCDVFSVEGSSQYVFEMLGRLVFWHTAALVKSSMEVL